ncbi:hypothetical protein AB0E12_13645 [Micromonospora chersina]|uniref:hypothetical protein n=1 Tax=Micromonospora chersina TaxID=47854 RepID=UPI0033E11B0C
MSAIALLYAVHRDRLVNERMPVHQIAEEFGRRVDADVFPYSGYLMLDMLTFLADRGVPIDRTALKVRTDPDAPDATVLTTEHRELLPRLDPAQYPVKEVREFLEDYDDLADDELQEAVTDTLGLLRTTIADLAENEVCVILIS